MQAPLRTELPNDGSGQMDRRAIVCPRCGGQAAFKHAQTGVVAQDKFVRLKRLTKHMKPFRVEASKAGRKSVRDQLIRVAKHPYHKGAAKADACQPQDYQQDSALGAVRCPQCHLSQWHSMNWPEEAYFQTSLRGHRLWFFHREHLAAVLPLFEGGPVQDRTQAGGWVHWYNISLPGRFKTVSARKRLVPQLKKLLAS